MNRREVLAAAGVLLAGGLPGCNRAWRAAPGPGSTTPTDDAGASSDGTPSGTPDAELPPGHHAVAFSGILGESRIDPVGLHVRPGDTVVFRNTAGLELGAPHSTRAYHPDNGTALRVPGDAEPWRSPLLAPGQTFAVTLSVPGTYDYYCATHRVHGGVGRVVVGEPGGPAHEGSPPHGALPSGERIVAEGAVTYDDRADDDLRRNRSSATRP